MPDTTSPTAPAEEVKTLDVPFGKTTVQMKADAITIKASKASKAKGKTDKVIDLMVPQFANNAAFVAFISTALAIADEKKPGNGLTLAQHLIAKPVRNASEVSVKGDDFDSDVYWTVFTSTETGGLKTTSAVDEELNPLQEDLLDLLDANRKGEESIKALASEYPSLVDKNGKVDRGAFNVIVTNLLTRKNQLQELRAQIVEKAAKKKADKAAKEAKEKAEAEAKKAAAGTPEAA